MRQVDESQQAFRGTLMRIRSCMANINEYKLLKSRLIGIAINEQSILEKNQIYFVPTRQMAHEFNTTKLNSSSESTG